MIHKTKKNVTKEDENGKNSGKHKQHYKTFKQTGHVKKKTLRGRVTLRRQILDKGFTKKKVIRGGGKKNKGDTGSVNHRKESVTVRNKASIYLPGLDAQTSTEPRGQTLTGISGQTKLNGKRWWQRNKKNPQPAITEDPNYNISTIRRDLGYNTYNIVEPVNSYNSNLYEVPYSSVSVQATKPNKPSLSVFAKIALLATKLKQKLLSKKKRDHQYENAKQFILPNTREVRGSNEMPPVIPTKKHTYVNFPTTEHTYANLPSGPQNNSTYEILNEVFPNGNQYHNYENLSQYNPYSNYDMLPPPIKPMDNYTPTSNLPITGTLEHTYVNLSSPNLNTATYVPFYPKQSADADAKAAAAAAAAAADLSSKQSKENTVRTPDPVFVQSQLLYEEMKNE